jgi:hypothetical protein
LRYGGPGAMQEEFEDIKGLIRIRNSKKNRQHNSQKDKGQRDKQRSTKHIHRTKDKKHLYVPLVVNTSRSFPHSRLITGVITRLTRRVSLVEQELPTLPEQ